MGNDGIEHVLEEIGQLLTNDEEYPNAEVLLYAKVERNAVSASIFMNFGNQISYRWDSRHLTYPLLDLWEAADPEKRWAEMDYVLRDGKFTIAFVYPEEIDAEEDPFERRTRIVRRHFGEKPIVYPPLPDAGELYDA